MKRGDEFTVAELTELAARVVNFINSDLMGEPVPLGVQRFIGNEIVMFSEMQLAEGYIIQQLRRELQRSEFMAGFGNGQGERV